MANIDYKKSMWLTINDTDVMLFEGKHDSYVLKNDVLCYTSFSPKYSRDDTIHLYKPILPGLYEHVVLEKGRYDDVMMSVYSQTEPYDFSKWTLKETKTGIVKDTKTEVISTTSSYPSYPSYYRKHAYSKYDSYYNYDSDYGRDLDDYSGAYYSYSSPKKSKITGKLLVEDQEYTLVDYDNNYTLSFEDEPTQEGLSSTKSMTEWWSTAIEPCNRCKKITLFRDLSVGNKEKMVLEWHYKDKVTAQRFSQEVPYCYTRWQLQETRYGHLNNKKTDDKFLSDVCEEFDDFSHLYD